jgi:plasmid maintenance system antidote protein VapI
VTAWDPDWVIRPGVFLAEEMKTRGLPVSSVSEITGLEVWDLVEILTGKHEINQDDADCLAKLGMSATMWMNLERSYRDGLAKGKVDTSDG